ncbi:uncharacterized protein G2W53_012460 [Senna tora]|uniref:Uncharacterized protein n=1 Tax=Senna tora TaxID=362788 RepID=A0A834TZ60_9FABA|nr:uncharacterized protein G2W53_012460 [Senna tora]
MATNMMEHPMQAESTHRQTKVNGEGNGHQGKVTARNSIRG